MSKIALAYVVTEFTAYPPVMMRINAPSLGSNPLRLTKGVALNYASEGQIYDFRDNPLELIRPGDNVTAYGYEADEAGVAHYLGTVIIVSDGSIPKGVNPPLTHVHRCTVGAATAGVWSQLALTEVDGLPAGKYNMYGARVESATAVAARFVFKGIEARPAVIPVSRTIDHVHSFSNFWGKPIPFEMPDGLPDVELLADAAETAGDIELYLQKVS